MFYELHLSILTGCVVFRAFIKYIYYALQISSQIESLGKLKRQNSMQKPDGPLANICEVLVLSDALDSFVDAVLNAN